MIRRFDPDAPCDRSWAVYYIWHAFGKPASTSDNPFTDVPDSSISAPAAVWAANQGIATGTSPTTFNPGGICSRAQIITFLYQAYHA